MMKNFKLTLLYPVLVLVVPVSSCSNGGASSQFSQGPVPVVTYTARTENVVFYNTYPATVVALNEVALHSEVNGYVTGVYFREGSHVNKGQKLYEIDRRKYQAAFDAAKANVGIAGSNLEKAQRDADRYLKLDEQNAIAKQVVEDSRTALENAKMQLKLAEANLLNAETDYKYSLITAPFSGLIGFSNVKPGAFVSAGQTLLTTLSSDDPVGVDFNISQESLSYFLKLQQEKINEKDSTFKVILPDNSEYNHFGKLSVIDRAIDPFTGTIRIRVVFRNGSGSLRPGMNSKIMVMDQNSGRHVVIPARATIEQMSENLVYLIEDNKVNQRKIIPGPNLGKYLVVEDGLSDGDTIVLDGLQNVRQGSVVSIEQPTGAEAGS